ncbi:MAG: ABC transporter permease [Cytophagaceae bacterium]|nr:ABC transporter permease [Cytophagaceae bacterium]
MNLYFLISSRLNSGDKKSFSATVRIISTVVIALGMAVILVSFAVLGGFKRAIKEKIFSLGGHIQVVMADTRESYEELPFASPTLFYLKADTLAGIAHVQSFINKTGLLQTKSEVQGVVLKGIGSDFLFENLKKNLLEGSLVSLADTPYSRKVVLSREIADKLSLRLNDSVWMYFLQNPPRYRKLVVCGIYETGLEEFDDKVIFGDIRLLRSLQQYNDSIVGGYDVFLHDPEALEEGFMNVFNEMDYFLAAIKITDKFPQVFDWLSLVDRNVLIFLILIILVSCFIMVSAVFIMIVERTNMIGLLKALGARNTQIAGIFLLNGMGIILKGMLIGNILAMLVCGIQYYFPVIPLDKTNYYMETVPIHWNWYYWLALNSVTLMMVGMVLILPVMAVSYLKPIRSIKFN